VFSFDDEDLEGWSQVKRTLNHLRGGIPACRNIPDHLFGHDPDLQAALFKLFFEGRTVRNLDSKSTKLRIDKNVYQ